MKSLTFRSFITALGILALLALCALGMPAQKFVHSILRSQDRISIFQVSEEVLQLTRFTPDARVIERGIDRLEKGAGTSLYDAIYLCSDTLLDRQGRKVMVLITDGGDTTSQ